LQLRKVAVCHVRPSPAGYVAGVALNFADSPAVKVCTTLEMGNERAAKFVTERHQELILAARWRSAKASVCSFRLRSKQLCSRGNAFEFDGRSVVLELAW
jgi:hypothetical protein